jgi:hypothetical protein
MEATLTLTIAPGQTIAVTLSESTEAKVLGMIATEHSTALAEQEVLTRTYHVSAKPTQGLNYDDRLTTRIKCGANMAYAYLSLSEKEGGLRHFRIGKKYLVTEQAVREWLGDRPATRR